MISLLLAASFLVPQDLEQKGDVMVVYPTHQQYVYAATPVFASARPVPRDGSEEDAYFAQREKGPPAFTLPLEQIVKARKAKAFPLIPKQGEQPKAIEKAPKMVNLSRFSLDRALYYAGELKRELAKSNMKEREALVKKAGFIQERLKEEVIGNPSGVKEYKPIMNDSGGKQP